MKQLTLIIPEDMDAPLTGTARTAGPTEAPRAAGSGRPGCFPQPRRFPLPFRRPRCPQDTRHYCHNTLLVN
jgi:hypothetical protein